MNIHQKLIEQLMETLEIIALNAGYPRYFENENCLSDPQIYFEICQRIFPEFNIKIIKIQEYRQALPGQKLQLLIDLLEQEVNVNLSDIQGDEIVGCNLTHIYKFLEMLYEYSKIYMESKKPQTDVQSAHGKEEKEEKPVIASARNPLIKYKDKDYQEEELKDHGEPVEPEQEEPIAYQPQKKLEKQTKKKKKRPGYSAAVKRQRSRNEERNNLHTNIVNTVINQKTKWIKAAQRDIRKNKLDDVEEAKKSYKCYLERYSKDGRATANRERAINKKVGAVKTISSELPRKDFQKIDNFFQSFAYKFRDKKAVYLRKIQNLINKQEQDRHCYQNRIERQKKKMIEEKLKLELEAQKHQNRIKTGVLQENKKILEGYIHQMQVEQRVKASRSRVELKAEKQRELQKIESLLKEDNAKVLMALEEGGRLEQTIMKMYKRL